MARWRVEYWDLPWGWGIAHRLRSRDLPAFPDRAGIRTLVAPATVPEGFFIVTAAFLICTGPSGSGGDPPPLIAGDLSGIVPERHDNSICYPAGKPEPAVKGTGLHKKKKEEREPAG